MIQSALGGFEAARGHSLASFGLLRLAGELRVRRAGFGELPFQVADPPAQELTLLGDAGDRTLGFLDRGGGLVGRLLRRARRIGGAIRGRLAPCRAAPTRALADPRRARDASAPAPDATWSLPWPALGAAGTAIAAVRSTSPSPA